MDTLPCYHSRWTPEEHRLFLEGIMLYGKDWKKMQPLIKSRSLVQIRTHAQKVFKKIGLKKALLMSAGKRVKLADGGTVGGGGDTSGNQVNISFLLHVLLFALYNTTVRHFANLSIASHIRATERILMETILLWVRRNFSCCSR